MELKNKTLYITDTSDLQVYIINSKNLDNGNLWILCNLYTKKSGRCMEYFGVYEVNPTQISHWNQVHLP